MNILQYCSDVDRAITINGLAYAQYLDPIAVDLIELKYNVISIADHNSKIIGNKSFNNPKKIFSNSIIYILLKALSKLTKIDMLTYLGVKYLKNRDIKLVYGIGQPKWLCNAARCINIPIVEIAHGMGLVKIEWGWDRRDKNELPTHFFVYDLVTLNTYKSFFDKKVTDIRLIENRYLSSSHLLTGAYKSDLIKKNKTYINAKIKILVFLQWGYLGEIEEYKELIPSGLLPENFIDFINNSGDDFFWIFKLHPVQLKSPKKYKSHFKILEEMEVLLKNIEWRAASETAISEVILASDICVTMSSTAAYDAANFGRKTLLLCPMQQDGCLNGNWFPDLKCRGLVKVYNKNESLEEFFRSNINKISGNEEIKVEASATTLIIELINSDNYD